MFSIKLLKIKTQQSDWNLSQSCLFRTFQKYYLCGLPALDYYCSSLSVTHKKRKQEKLFHILLPNNIEKDVHLQD